MTKNHALSEWGRKGGRQTSQNPTNWLRNLKQFRDRPDPDALAEKYQPKIRQLKLPF